MASGRTQHYGLGSTGLHWREASLDATFQQDLNAPAAAYLVALHHVNHKEMPWAASGSAAEQNQAQHAAALQGGVGLDHNLMLVRQGDIGMVCQSYYNQYTLQHWCDFDQPLSRSCSLPTADPRTAVQPSPLYRGLLNITQMRALCEAIDCILEHQWCEALADKYTDVTGISVSEMVDPSPVLVGVSVSKLNCSMLGAVSEVTKIFE